MSIFFECPDCQKEYRVRESFAGRRINCKSCGCPIEVPSSIDEDEFLESLPSARRNPRPSEQPARRSSPRRSKQRRSVAADSSSSISTRAKIITLIVVGVLSIPVGCIGIVTVFLPNPREMADLPAMESNPVPYLQRRAELETKLKKKTVAPQEYDRFNVPQGVEEVTYDSQGLSLKAWVDRRGATQEKSHAIVFFHGGFAISLSDIEESCARFREAGYVVMCPALRGENGNPGNFELFFGEVDDAANACRWLAKQDYVDQDRIYTFGHSVGGGISALLSLQEDLPVVCTGGSGGLYSEDVFFDWIDIMPYRNSDAENNVRVLVG
ncbi:MAG: prolyl oligopeptidase family serine peptidase, partial [Planctomycetaceae bacterium]|nr:prolyl oligopeptidase family serine peptidase [Planctomycetaceae bacterium]